MAEQNKIEVFERDGFVFIVPMGLSNNDGINRFKKAILDASETRNCHIALDLLHVDYLYSSAINLLIKLYKKQTEKHKRVVIINPSNTAKTVLQAVSLGNLIPTFDSMNTFIEWSKGIDRYVPAAANARMTVENGQEKTVVRFEGEPASLNAMIVKTGFTDLLEKATNQTVIIDFHKIVSLESTSLSSLVTLARKLRENNGQLILAGLNEILKELIEVLGIDECFLVAENVEQALKT